MAEPTKLVAAVGAEDDTTVSESNDDDDLADFMKVVDSLEEQKEGDNFIGVVNSLEDPKEA